MCFAKSNAAERARQAEEERQNRVRGGVERVNRTFSQFDDDFFAGQRENALNALNPQLEKQADDARRQLVLSLAGTGNLNSSAGARQLGDFTELFRNKQAEVGQQALDFEQGARADLEGSRSRIVQQLQATGDLGAASNAALAGAESLRAPRSVSPIGNLFEGFTQNLTARELSQRNQRRNDAVRSVFPSSGGGSSRVVG